MPRRKFVPPTGRGRPLYDRLIRTARRIEINNKPMPGLHGPRKAEALLHEFAHAVTLPGFKMPEGLTAMMGQVGLVCPEDGTSEVTALAAELPFAIAFGFLYDVNAWLDSEEERQHIPNLRRRVRRYTKTSRSKRQQQRLRQLLGKHLHA
jgi:hypothetical protein